MLDVAAIRRDFPILSRRVRGRPLVYLDNAATSQKPRQVIEAISSYYEKSNANVHRGVHFLSEEATVLMDAARAKTAAFLNSPSPDSVVFTRNATESINLAAHAWGRKFLKSGDEILLTEMEHHSNLVPWQILAAEKGVKLKFIPVRPDGTLDMEEASRQAGPRTRLVSFTALSNALGTVNPVPELIALARRSGARALVDASQWAPHRPIDVQAWDCDFMALSGHKMLGPTGIGVLYGKRDLLEAMDPFLGGGDMIRQVFLDRSTYNDVPYKFEAGTPNIEGAVGFAAALDYILNVGFEDMARHEEALMERAMAALPQKGVEIYGPRRPGLRSCVISFNIDGVHPHDVSTALDLEGVAVRAGHHCCQPLMSKLRVPGTARASFYLYNTLDEVDALVHAVSKTLRFFHGREAALAGESRG